MPTRDVGLLSTALTILVVVAVLACREGGAPDASATVARTDRRSAEAPAAMAEAPSQSRAPVEEPSDDQAIRLVSGTVCDELHSPVTEFRVALLPWAVPPPDASGHRGIAVNDRLGRFTYRTSDSGPWTITIQSPGYQALSIGPVHGGVPLALCLLRPALIHGRTLGPDGLPIGPIGIECVDVTDARTIVARAQSDSQGQFQLTPEAPGTFLVGVAGETTRSTVLCRTGVPVALDVLVPPATTVHCRVVTAGMPVAGVSLSLGTPAGIRVEKSDAGGAVVWQCVPRGSHRLIVRARGFDAQEHLLDTRRPDRITFSHEFELVPWTR